MKKRKLKFEVDELSISVRQQTLNLISKAESLYNIIITTPIIDNDLKGVCAGRAYYKGTWKIRYNYAILKKYPTEFLNETVPHEVAHLIEYQIYGKTGHKKNWKNIMKDLGVPNPQRCHHYKI